MKLTQLMKLTNMKKKDIAKALNVTTSALYNYEKGINEPTLSVLVKMADLFHVSIDSLAERETKQIDLSMLSKTKQEIVKEIINIEPNKAEKVLAYVQGITES